MTTLPMGSSFPAFWEAESFLEKSFSHRRETRESKKLSECFPDAFPMLPSRVRVGGKKAAFPESFPIFPLWGKNPQAAKHAPCLGRLKAAAQKAQALRMYPA